MTDVDGFFADLNAAVPSEGRTKIDKVLADTSLSEQFRNELLAALLTPRFSAQLISNQLRSRSIDVGVTAVKNYRRDLWVLILAKVELEESDGQ